MQGFADKVDRIASNNRRTDIELFQVCRALNEPNVPTLLSLREKGLPAYKAGEWRIDCRSFRKWATTYTPYHPNRKPQAIYKEEQLFWNRRSAYRSPSRTTTGHSPATWR